MERCCSSEQGDDPQGCCADISSKICKNYLKHVKHVEKSYWKTDRIIGAKLDRLLIALEAKDNKDDNDSD